MNKKNILVLVGSLACVALLGYFTYSTVSTLMKSKSVSQEVSVNENTSSDNKDKNSQNDLSERQKYTLKEDEKLSDVAKKFKDTCTVNSSLNIIKSLNQISNTSSLESGDTVLVPVNAFQDGKKYSVKEGDTWYSIARKHYPKYNHEVVIDFLMDINPFNNDILPLGEDIFLPNI